MDTQHPHVPKQSFFVAGTDTGVGKTLCSAALLHGWATAGVLAAGFKPLASGAEAAGNEDVLALQAASGAACRGDYAEHNVYTFAEATAPHLAAADAGIRVDTHRLSHALARWQQRADVVVVEGAGGWHTPLDAQQDFADWVMAERLPVILVVGIRLGALNHALLTARAVAAAGLPLSGWIANCLEPEFARQQDYVACLRQRLPAPLLGVVPRVADATAAATYLDVSLLAEV